MGGWGKEVVFADIMQHILTLFKAMIQCCRNPAKPPLQIPLQTIRRNFTGRIKDSSPEDCPSWIFFVFAEAQTM